VKYSVCCRREDHGAPAPVKREHSDSGWVRINHSSPRAKTDDPKAARSLTEADLVARNKEYKKQLKKEALDEKKAAFRSQLGLNKH